MKKPRIENKCTNCLSSGSCHMAGRAVVWKNCEKFRLDLTGLKEAAMRKPPATPCRHGVERRHSLEKDEVYCEVSGRWMDVIRGECLGVCSAEEGAR